MKQFFFMAGLPRSGSTLLSSILNQNPEIHSSSNSPVCSAITQVRQHVLLSEQYNAYPKPKSLSKSLFGILENYYYDVDSSFIIDKSREWSTIENMAVLGEILPYQPKVILTVRNVLDVLASFIKLVEDSNNSDNLLDKQINTNDFNFYRPINDIRCDYLMRPKGIMDNALYGIANATMNPSNFHFVEYEDLVNNPESVVTGIYKFLEIPEFQHSFTNIVNTVKENDDVYGLPGMHDVRPSISKRNIDYRDFLSDYIINKYSNLEFWR